MKCFSVALFTKRWKEVRDFYVKLLGCKVVSEEESRYCALDAGGVPLCLDPCDAHGEDYPVSHVRLHFSLPERDALIQRLRTNGVSVTISEKYAEFQDPEGRSIHLTDSQ